MDFTLGLFMGAIAIPRDKRNRQPSRELVAAATGWLSARKKRNSSTNDLTADHKRNN
jgi:hypothetical protein